MRTHVRLARCCFCFCPCSVMPLLCTKKIPISNRSSHSSRDRALSHSVHSLTRPLSLSPSLSLLTQHSGCCYCCCCWVSGGCFSIGLFCWSFFLAERTLNRESESIVELREREQWVVTWVQTELWVLLVWSSQSGRSGVCVCMRVTMCASASVCVMGSSRWLDNIRRVNWPNEHNRDFGTTNWAQTQLNLTSSRVTSVIA